MERELLHKVYITEIDANSRIERRILKGIGSGYSFDMALWRKHLNVKWDVCVRMKSIDGKHTGQLHTASEPWRMFSMDINGPSIQVSIKQNK